jgi:SDR family mycofactocin-dependent oxidoreductase
MNATASTQQDPSTATITQHGPRLSGRKAVVTGAARGIGRAIAVAFAEQGADVMGIDIAGPVSPASEAEPATREDLDETGRRVEAQGRRFIAVVADVRNLDALKNAADRATREFGDLDIVVANAGIQTFVPILEMNDAQWHDLIDVNLNGCANTIRAFAPPMVARKRGRIILVASGQGRHGTKNASSYSASKWGVIGLMKSVALELAPHGITVNCIEPGLVQTKLTCNPTRLAAAIEEVEHIEHAPGDAGRAEHDLSRKNPMHVPWLQPEDVAPVAVFLASDEAHRVCGATYDVNAGDSATYTA